MHDVELMNAPSLSDQFPIEFTNGYKINTILFWCTACYAVSPLADVHGYVSRIIDGVADITAATVCRCGNSTKYRIRLRDDGTFSYPEDDHWVNKSALHSKPETILKKIRTKFAVYSLRLKYVQLMHRAKKLQKTLKQ